MPIVDEKAPTEVDFDNLLNLVKMSGPNTACVFNCQVNR